MSQFEPRPFGKYFLTDRIAVGGMAEIYKAKTFGVDGFEKNLAIKKILPNYSNDKEFITMLIDEAKLVVNLSHPNIVQIYDLGCVGSDYFISMEFINGVNLRELMNRGLELNQKVPEEICLYIMAEICKGLDYAHSKLGPDGQPLHIVHRDVSPHNILVSFEGEVKIVDFGIAKAALNVSQTQLGALKGKVTYMSPEQAVGKPIDHRTDIFSCGIVLYEILTGERLFSGESQLAVLNQIKQARLTFTDLKSKMPEGIAKIVAKALAHNVNERYQSASDMQVDITRYLYSHYHDFSPRKLNELLAKWYGSMQTSSPEVSQEELPKYDEKSAVLNSMKEQINIVHRKTAEDEMLPETLRVGEVEPSQFIKQLHSHKSAQLSQSGLKHFAEEDEPTVKKSIEEITERSLPQVSQINKQSQDGGIGEESGIVGQSVKEKVEQQALTHQFEPKKFILGIIVSVLLVLASVYFIYWKASEDAVEQIVTVQTASIKVASYPPQAKIYLNGEETKLLTPTVVDDLKLGEEYELSLIKDGYEPVLTNIVLDSDHPLPLYFELGKIQSDSYTVTIYSEPKGAEVYINKQPTGKKTPADFENFRVGRKYELVLKHDDYHDYHLPFESAVAKDQVVDVSMQKLSKAQIQVNSQPAGAKIFLNGKNTGFMTPHTFMKIQVPQVLEFKLQKDGFESVLETIALIEEGEKKIYLNLQPAQDEYAVLIHSNVKGAKVFLNGKVIGQTPLKTNLSYGKHQLALEIEGFKKLQKDVYVEKPNQKIFFRFQPTHDEAAKKI